MDRARLRALLPAALVLVAGCDGTTGVDPGADDPPPVLVFDMVHEGQRDIFRVALDGSDLVRLTRDPAEDVAPTMAGERVVFTSYRDGHAQLYTVSAESGGSARVLESEASHTDPALSRQADALAFVSDEDGTLSLWVADEDGGEAAPLTDGFGHGASLEFWPDWSPDGDRLVFVTTADGSSDLWVADVRARTFSPRVSGPDAYLQPAWSPDGERVAFTSDRDGDLGIFTVDASQDIQRVTPGYERAAEAAWLAEDTVVYVSYDADGGSRLRWIATSGSGGAGEIPLPVDADPRRPAVRW